MAALDILGALVGASALLWLTARLDPDRPRRAIVEAEVRPSADVPVGDSLPTA